MPALETPPAPTATPAPSPAPSATPAPAPQPSGSDDPFSQKLETLIGPDTDPKPAPQPKPAEPKKPEPAKPAAPKLTEKAAEPKQTGPKELREELERTRTELATFKKTSDELSTKIKDYEAKGKDTEALRARLEQRDKEFAEMQGELRMLKRESSPEFKKQYEEPFARAAAQAERLMKRVTKTDANGQPVPATFDDFVAIYALSKTNYGRAAATAREHFGDDQAPIIMDQVRELDRLESARNEAMEEEKKGWAEREKAEQGRRVQEREQEAALWKQVNEDLKNSVEDYRDPVDDKELAEARARGIEIFDAKPESRQQHLVKSAHIRHRLGAYEAQKLQLARQATRIAELEAALEESKPRQPGAEPRRPGGEPAAQPEESFEEAVAAGKWKV